MTTSDPGSPVLGTYPLCGQHLGIVGDVLHMECSHAAWGRYVIVQIDGSEKLALCEVEVFQTGKFNMNTSFCQFILSSFLSSLCNIPKAKSLYAFLLRSNFNKNVLKSVHI